MRLLAACLHPKPTQRKGDFDAHTTESEGDIDPPHVTSEQIMTWNAAASGPRKEITIEVKGRQRVSAGFSRQGDATWDRVTMAASD